ncbi:Histidine ammonia-lyase [Moelleriella libera RCEF 2490]|uniref:Histidine ammonia-lyase n=1 Tax=Moelleriella libera RCEF 2490 TaxID=1081109 RepID=A0A162IV18_9HYPO|nr:Histidine ammonia-lyase [Moelleriella libera RCEF 2490]
MTTRITSKTGNKTVHLVPGKVSLGLFQAIYETDVIPILDPGAYEAIQRSADGVTASLNDDNVYYGFKTGIGKLASIRVPVEDAQAIQRNIVLSHCCGVGKPLTDSVVRLIMTLKLISLGRGASGVRRNVVDTLAKMLQLGVLPVIPEKGSVGASGDLAPLSHMAAAMMGEAAVKVNGKVVNGIEGLASAGIQPVVLRAKEGVALINGTQASTAIALAGLFRAHRALCSSLISGALSTDAAMGSTSPFHPEIQALRGHQGQIDVAASLCALLKSSEIRDSHVLNDTRVQDPYSIRCQPQVAGACLDLIRQAGQTLQIEGNAATDNPLVLSDGSIISGGNFHAEPVAFAADQLAMAICEIGSISQRRIALLVDSSLSYGLPAFLTSTPGYSSGFMTAEVTAAALMSENKQMSHPASVDSTPTSANQEDHVSMACHAARRLFAMTDNVCSIIGIEVLAALQGIDFRSPLSTSPELSSVHQTVRSRIPKLEADRYMADDLALIAEMVSSGRLVESVDESILPGL